MKWNWESALGYTNKILVWKSGQHIHILNEKVFGGGISKVASEGACMSLSCLPETRKVVTWAQLTPYSFPEAVLMIPRAR